MQKIWVHLLGWEDSLEKRVATDSSILAWRIPWTVLFMGSQRVGHYWVISLHFYIKNVRVRSLIMAGFLCYVDGLPEYQPIREAGAAAAKSLQSCPTLWDPTDPTEPTGSPVPGILQARTLEWVAIAFSNAWKWKVKVKSFSCVWLLATLWTAAYQAPPSMGFFQAKILEWGAIAFSDNRS